MEEYLVKLLLAIVLGIIGSGTRIVFQYWSYKEAPPHPDIYGYLAALFLGGVGGWISWELPKYMSWDYGRLGSFVLGYFFPDIIENLLEGFKPPISD